MVTARTENSGGVSRTEKGDSTVRIRQRQAAIKQDGEEREKGHHLTRKLMNTSAGRKRLEVVGNIDLSHRYRRRTANLPSM
jgi:hypothetical protein